MRHHAKEKYPQTGLWWNKTITMTTPISLESLMSKEWPMSMDDGDMRKLSVRMDPNNEDSTRVK